MATQVEIQIRRLDDADQELCQTFDCGDEPYEEEINRYVREIRWQKGRVKEEALIAEDVATGRVVGFGTWKHTLATFEEDITVIRVAYFGVDRAYQGRRCQTGQSCAATLYATLEEDAVGHPASTPDMPIELFCHGDNKRGRAFWQRMGFEIVDEDTGHDYVRYWRR